MIKLLFSLGPFISETIESRGECGNLEGMSLSKRAVVSQFSLIIAMIKLIKLCTQSSCCLSFQGKCEIQMFYVKYFPF